MFPVMMVVGLLLVIGIYYTVISESINALSWVYKKIR